MSICDKNCFECPHPDCICDDMDADDWRAARKIDEFAAPKSAKQKAIAANHRAYYEAHREERNAYMRAYRKRKRAEKKREEAS